MLCRNFAFSISTNTHKRVLFLNRMFFGNAVNGGGTNINDAFDILFKSSLENKFGAVDSGGSDVVGTFER